MSKTVAGRRGVLRTSVGRESRVSPVVLVLLAAFYGAGINGLWVDRCLVRRLRFF